MSKKRSPRATPSHDDFYMGLSFWVAAKSKDPDTQIGSCIVNAENRPLGIGYNGPPRRIADDKIDWNRPFKYDFIKHAEENAIDHSWDLSDTTLYVTAKPCKKCMLIISSHPIKKVIYYPLKPKTGSSLGNEVYDKTNEIAKLSNVILKKFDGNLNWMRDHINWMDSLGIFD